MIPRIVVLMIVSLAAPARADWPQFLGPTRNGVYAGDDLAAGWPNGGLPVVWRRDVGQGFSGPVVVGRRVILFHRVDDQEVVECLDAELGKPLWSRSSATEYRDDFGMDEGPRATPAIAEGKVYTLGAQGLLQCFELERGKPVWSIDTAKELGAAKGFFGMACSPLVEGDAVIVNVGGKGGAGVVAFDRKTGRELWRATDDEAGYASPVAATFGNRRRVVAFTAAGLSLIDPAGGKVVARFPWRAPIRASVNAASPLVIGRQIFISASYDTGAALLRVGENDDGLERVWSGNDAMSNHYATCVAHEGLLFGFHGRQEQGPSLRCVELSSGKVRWDEEGFGAGTLVLTRGKLLILTEKGELILAPATPDGFKPVARAQVFGFECRAHPALAAGRLYARGRDKLVCVNLHR